MSTPTLKIRDLADIATDSELLALVAGHPVTALLGSAVSIWEPTNVPTGIQFTRGVFEALFKDASGLVDDPLGDGLFDHFRRIPFEHALEKCPDRDALRAFLRELYDANAPNDVHRLFAESVVSGRIAAIVTTNYDGALDAALEERLGPRAGARIGIVPRIVETGDVPTPLDRDAPIYFKIHGTADDPSGRTLVFTMRQEHVLEPWKRELLSAVFTGRILLVVGYSGLDFEICPEIPLMKPAFIVWNFLTPEEITPHARRVLAEVPGVVIIGDMRDLLTRLFHRITLSKGTPRMDVRSELSCRLSDDVKLLWRARLLNSLSYARSALATTGSALRTPALSPVLRRDLLDEQAQGYHFAGAYRSAARGYEQAAELADATPEGRGLRCRLLLDACDNWRCHGAFLKSVVCLRRARAFATGSADASELIARTRLKKLLLAHHLHAFAWKLRLRPLRRFVLARVTAAIPEIARDLAASGAWIEYQQLRLWTERFELPSALTRLPGLYEAPPSRDGYLHLGYVMAQAMVARAELQAAGASAGPDLIHECQDRLRVLNEFGVHAEAWKLSKALGRVHRAQSKAHHRRCEYSVIGQLANRLFR